MVRQLGPIGFLRRESHTLKLTVQVARRMWENGIPRRVHDYQMPLGLVRMVRDLQRPANPASPERFAAARAGTTNAGPAKAGTPNHQTFFPMKPQITDVSSDGRHAKSEAMPAGDAAESNEAASFGLPSQLPLSTQGGAGVNACAASPSLHPSPYTFTDS